MGALFGLLAFSRALKWLLTNRRRQTLSLLTGFLAGSLQALWPWKTNREQYTHSDGRVEWLLRNSWPHHWNVELWSAVGLFIIGATVVTLLQRWGDCPPEASSMNGNEKTWLGVIGHPISHSMSLSIVSRHFPQTQQVGPRISCV